VGIVWQAVIAVTCRGVVAAAIEAMLGIVIHALTESNHP